MKAIIQRVRSASVTVNGQIVSSISRGLLVLVGIGTEDLPKDAEYCLSKILGLKLFPKEEEEHWGWAKSVVEAEGEVLCVSQFTLFANTKKGMKPDFHAAMGGDASKIMYETFLGDLRSQYQADRIHDGIFGEMMDVALVNDGPCTIIVDSRDAPASATPKPVFTNEMKQNRKAELALKAASKAERQARYIAEQETANKVE